MRTLLRGIIIFIITKWVEPEIRNYTSRPILAGIGYSEDSQQIVSQVCYNATVSSTSEQQVIVALDTALSSSKLGDELGISVSVSGKYAMFSADGEARYLRSMQDTEYSMSLNYYEFATNNVAVQLAGIGDKALTESGKAFYNNGNNTYFGILCGDNYITSYKQGTLLITGLEITFSSPEAKNEFEGKISAGFGNIVNAATSIKKIVTDHNLTASITIKSFQKGGEPSHLSNILRKDSNDLYYTLTCSLTQFNNCIAAASDLLDYAKNDFSKQFSFERNIGLVPLGAGSIKYAPIYYIDLKNTSLVTEEVTQYRKELSSILKENEYYQQIISHFLNGYPVESDNDLIKSARSMLSKVRGNVQILMQPHGGAADCFNFPDKCKIIKNDIDSQLLNITVNATKLLEDLRLSVVPLGARFQPNNSGSNILDDVSIVDQL